MWLGHAKPLLCNPFPNKDYMKGPYITKKNPKPKPKRTENQHESKEIKNKNGIMKNKNNNTIIDTLDLKIYQVLW